LQAYYLATEAAQKARQKQKEGYDIRIRGAAIKPGDRVLVKVVSFDGKHKLADRWEHDSYIVLSHPNNDIPVCNLHKENNEGRTRTLHRNLFLPIGYIRDVPTPAPRKLLNRPPISAKGNIRNKIKELEHPHTDNHTTDISSDDKSEHGYIVISQEEPVYSDSTIIEEPLVQQTDQISDADDEDAHTSTDTVDSANEDESAEKSAWQQISDESVKKYLSKVKESKSQGSDSIHPKLIKETVVSISKPVTKIFKKSMEEKKLPTIWKIANITPIHKKGHKYDVSNNRPISLTSIICKTIGKIIRDTLMSHMEENNFFTVHQHGFRKGRSCVTQLIEVVEKWIEELDTITPSTQST
jgi:predicted DNA binding CopG/RHH family protein